ncbi:hypothetical protein [Reichenbachiella versicolor]|uniref:hypothetical protein n=1 Tax=Reichenbachiella versicolor TaxID=1821036 RepID=UPI0013A57232|nr:hypothetical protein [Reichenbachiella versicolor]
MKNLRKYIGVGLMSLVVLSCDDYDSLVQEEIDQNNPNETEVTAPTGDSGELDLSTYVSLGASITAGVMDNSIYVASQNNSFPVILAQQFKAEGVGGGDFNVPTVKSITGCQDEDEGCPEGRLLLDVAAAGLVNDAGESIGTFDGDKSTLNNYGIPGAIALNFVQAATGGPDSDLNPLYNGFYARMASTPGVSTPIGDALAKAPTFMTLWFGGNEVLGYATSGGTGSDLDPNGAFNASFSGIVANVIASSAAKGVVINVPSVLALPFFQAVQWNDLELDQANADALNTGLEGYNNAVQGLVVAGLIVQQEADARKISYSPGKNGFMIVDSTLTDFGPEWDKLVLASQMTSQERAQLEPYRLVRHIAGVDGDATQSETVLLTASTIINTTPTGLPETILTGLSYPLPDSLVLTGAEKVAIETTRGAINAHIKSVVDANSDRLILYDVETLLLGIAVAGGYDVDGITVTYDFLPTGMFSNDAIHINARGSAILANEIMKAMESKWNADLPKVNPLDYASSPVKL